jgi:hypothetical protein
MIGDTEERIEDALPLPARRVEHVAVFHTRFRFVTSPTPAAVTAHVSSDFTKTSAN